MGRANTKPANTALNPAEETVSGDRRPSFALLQANLAVALISLARFPSEPKPETLIRRASDAVEAVVRAANDPALAASALTGVEGGASREDFEQALAVHTKSFGDAVEAAFKEQNKALEDRLAATDKALADHAAAGVQLNERLAKVEALLDGVSEPQEVIGRLMSLHERLERFESAQPAPDAGSGADEAAADKG